MLEVLEIIAILACIVFWVITVFHIISTSISGYFKEQILSCSILIIISIVSTFGGWYLDAQINIKNSLAEIKAYEQYKAEYTADKIIDTEIERDYVKAIQKLEYYKSIGIYKEEIIKKENNKEFEEKIKDIPRTNWVSGDIIPVVGKSGKTYYKTSDPYIFLQSKVGGGYEPIKFSTIIEEFGDYGSVKGNLGYLFEDNFYVLTAPGEYKIYE